MQVSKNWFNSLVNKWFVSLVDTPGSRLYFKNTMNGLAQADVGLLVVPADDYGSVFAKSNRKTGAVEGMCRVHTLALKVAGIKQVIVAINKMDAVKYEHEGFHDAVKACKNMMSKMGWTESQLESERATVIFVPVSAWEGENVKMPSKRMRWWKGVSLQVPTVVQHSKSKKPAHGWMDARIHTLLEAVDLFARPLPQLPDAPVRLPVSGVYKIRGVGTVVTGRLEQGTIQPNITLTRSIQKAKPGGFGQQRNKRKPGNKHAKKNSIEDQQFKVRTIESHHLPLKIGEAGCIIGVNIVGNNAQEVEVGDVLTAGRALLPAASFTAVVQVTGAVGNLTSGTEPIAFCRTGRSRARVVAINWKMRGDNRKEGKEEFPSFVRKGDAAELVFEALEPLYLQPAGGSAGGGAVAGLSRVMFFDAARGEGMTCIMVGKVKSVTAHAYTA